MDTIATAVDRYPWLLVVVVVVTVMKFVAQGLAETSESAAKWLGPIGNHWRRSGQRRREREAADIVDLRRQVEHLAGRLDSVTADRDCVSDYLEYDARWHSNIRVYAAENGIDFPPPPHLTFREYRAEWKQRHNEATA